MICSFDTVSIRTANMAIDISKNRNGGFMLASLSLIFIVGLAMGAICQKLKLPRIIGILVTGIVLGPYVLGAVSPAVVIPRMVALMEKNMAPRKQSHRWSWRVRRAMIFLSSYCLRHF